MGLDLLARPSNDNKGTIVPTKLSVSTNKSSIIESLKTKQFDFTILTKEYVESNRCSAYNYAL